VLFRSPTPKGGRLAVFITAHTWEHTNLKHLRTGAKVNIEIDIIAIYVQEFLRRKDAP
jgi:riboflavin synthase